ncbi:hypothetical protein DNO_0006 [Dichelobacter nodosus VCS1703A]|uniref:Uncharacterized protein n=1 Tax=Dichelobacter nodosus (strain VCS1703A) TaxID=246195 RepID=A5EX01_DICNV|nr:hypothetical protein DNO_0006 [Dichelobacter nodosus VCS1703A]
MYHEWCFLHGKGSIKMIDIISLNPRRRAMFHVAIALINCRNQLLIYFLVLF